MSQDPLCPNLTQKVQKEVSQMANRNFLPVILLGGLSVNLNHLKIGTSYFLEPPCVRCHFIFILLFFYQEVFTLLAKAVEKTLNLC